MKTLAWVVSVVVGSTAVAGAAESKPAKAPAKAESKAAPEAKPAAEAKDAAPATLVVALKDAKGAAVGSVTLVDTAAGVLMKGDVQGLPPGPHAIHLHAVGKCEPPFQSAGGHFNPGGHQHGFANPAGHHAGDLPNLVVPDSGSLKFEVLAAGVRFQDGTAKLLDEDGAAVVIHASADDYKTDPAGAAGDRIACGVISK